VIDILLPFYGDPALLRQTVRSVLAQTSTDFRLVVVDDAYPDDSVEPWFATIDDARVEYHRNGTNLGVNGNFMRALSHARAEHIVFMGCDDLLEPDYVRAVTAAIRQHPQAAVVAPGVQVIDADGVPTEPLVDRVKRFLKPGTKGVTRLAGEDALVSLLRGNWSYFPSLCWRRDLVSAVGFRPEYGVVLDLGLLVDVLSAGGDLVLLPETLFRYRRHANSESSLKTQTRARFAEERAYFETAARELETAGLRRAARASRLHLTSRLHTAVLLPAAVRKGDLTAARHLLQHACR
jgi:glycosyltransferase involved in cell wall biosynthesis